MAEAYGWTPDQVSQMTLPQIAMYCGESESRERPDDWSQFGLYKDPECPTRLKGRLADLERYAEYRRRLEDQ